VEKPHKRGDIQGYPSSRLARPPPWLGRLFFRFRLRSPTQSGVSPFASGVNGAPPPKPGSCLVALRGVIPELLTR
jgi:hypothetical protein